VAMPGDRAGRREYLEFEIEIGAGRGRNFPVTVRSPAGEAREQMRFPFDELALENRLQALEIALLQASGTRRSVRTTQEETVQEFGKALFDTLLSGQIRNCYDMSRMKAQQEEVPLRFKLRIDSPQLAALPWEFLCDPRDQSYLSLSLRTPIVRYPSLAKPVEPLPVKPPLRILGMICSPTDLPELDVERERERVEAAVKNLRQVELEWIPGQTWRDLMQAMRRGPWHIFHFIGHGGFDARSDEGMLVLARDDGASHELHASDLRHLIADHFSLRFVFLNACEGARGGRRDVFSSTAANLVQNGVPAVLAMQYEISDHAAVEFSRTFYEGLADATPVDEAITEARKAVRLGSPNSLEWGTPVLYMHTHDTLLFEMDRSASPAAAAPAPETVPETPAPKPILETPTSPSAPVVDAPRPEPPPARWSEPLKVLEELRSSPALTRQPAPVAAPTVRVLSAHTRPLSSIAFAPSAPIVVSGALDQTVRVWSIADGRQIALLAGHTKQVNHLAFSPDGQLLASAGGGGWGTDDCVVRLWRAADGGSAGVLAGHTGQVQCVAFSPSSKLLATAAADTTVRVWRIDGTPLHTLRGHTKQVRWVAFAADGQTLVSKANDTTIRFWRVSDGAPVGSVRGLLSSSSVALSPDGRFIASGGLDGVLRVWRIADGSVAFTSQALRQVNDVAFSRDGRVLACAAEDGTVRLWREWSVGAGDPAILSGHGKPVRLVALSPDRQLIASAAADRTVRLWRVANGEALLALNDQLKPSTCLAFSPDGAVLAAGSEDNHLRLWVCSGF